MKRFYVMFVLVIGIANAQCTCKCVNGKVQALCDNSFDIRPICSPQVCPLPAPSIAPIQPPTLPPLGTTHCQQKQVYNNHTRSYEWKTICE